VHEFITAAAPRPRPGGRSTQPGARGARSGAGADNLRGRGTDAGAHGTSPAPGNPGILGSRGTDAGIPGILGSRGTGAGNLGSRGTCARSPRPDRRLATSEAAAPAFTNSALRHWRPET
jgi:hypothetical protein